MTQDQLEAKPIQRPKKIGSTEKPNPIDQTRFSTVSRTGSDPGNCSSRRSRWKWTPRIDSKRTNGCDETRFGISRFQETTTTATTTTATTTTTTATTTATMTTMRLQQKFSSWPFLFNAEQVTGFQNRLFSAIQSKKPK